MNREHSYSEPKQFIHLEDEYKHVNEYRHLNLSVEKSVQCVTNLSELQVCDGVQIDRAFVGHVVEHV